MQKALEGLMENRITLISAHRLAIILKADRILVMDKGVLVKEGAYAELVAKNGVYAYLAKLQLSPK